jgi:hypothetical protein
VITLPVTALLLWLHAPAALMLGPLVAAMVFASSGGKVQLPVSVSVVAQGIVGCMIAKMVPLSIVGDVLDHWKLFTFGVLSVVAASSFLGWLMTRPEMAARHHRALGLQPGGRVGDDLHGRGLRRRHAARGLHAVFPGRPCGRDRSGGGQAVRRQRHPSRHGDRMVSTRRLAVARRDAGACHPGPVLARVLRIPAGAFLVPLVGGVVLTHFGWMTIELPTWLLALSYAVVGWNVGLRFSRPLLLHAARLLPRMLVSTLALIVLCGRPRGGDGDGRRHRSDDGLPRHQPGRLRFDCHHRRLQ